MHAWSSINDGFLALGHFQNFPLPTHPPPTYFLHGPRSAPHVFCSFNPAMRLRRHAQLLESTLKTTVAARPSLVCRSRRSPLSQCRYQSASIVPPNNIAVFGGGISGLASAYFLSKEFPKCKITIFEAGKETGGWIRSKRVQVPGGDILFEMGPRTLRSSTPTLHLVGNGSIGCHNAQLTFSD